MGFWDGLFGGGGGGSGVTQTVVNNSPWSAQQAPLQFGFDQARAQYDRGPQQFYPGSTVVPFSNQTQQALTGLENTANNTAGSLIPGAVGQAQNMINGGMLNGNPFIDAAFNRAAQGVQGQLASHFVGTGGQGSAMHQGASGDAMANLAAQMYGQNFANERQAQNQMIGQAGQLESLRYNPMQQLMGVGATREAQAGAEIQDQMARFNFDQNAGRSNLQNYMALVGGGSYGGQQQSSVPNFSNPFANALALGFGGVGALGTLFGQQGVFPNAMGR